MSREVYKRLSVIERVMSKIEKDKKTKCWNFLGASDSEGYGRIYRKGKVIFVHRYVYWYYNIKPLGTTWKEFVENNKDLDVCHRCDNPRCCNPEHLFLSTQSTNVQDCKNKNRIAKGENNGNNKLIKEQVLKIYRMKGTQQDIADKFGISQQEVSGIKTGKSWGWFTKGIK